MLSTARMTTGGKWYIDASTQTGEAEPVDYTKPIVVSADVMAAIESCGLGDYVLRGKRTKRAAKPIVRFGSDGDWAWAEKL